MLPDTIEDTPIFRAHIQPREPVVAVRTFNTNTRLEQRDDGITVLVEDIHEVLTLRY